MCMRTCGKRVLTSVRARRRLVCVRDRPACVSRACVALTYRVRACRARVVTSVRARRRLVCVCAACVLSRACVRAR